MKEKDFTDYQYDEQYENDSNKTDMIDDSGMNVFGFNDDLNMDDRIIVQNPTENQIYNLVERPKYLMQFEFRESERELLLHVCKSEQKRSFGYLVFLAVLNKFSIFANAYYDEIWSDEVFVTLLSCFVVIELLLLTKYNNFTIESIDYWRYVMHLYFLLSMGALLYYQMMCANDWDLVNI